MCTTRVTSSKFRYSVGLIRRAELSAEGLHERIQLQAANATEAMHCARHVTGALTVFDAQRLGEVFA